LIISEALSSESRRAAAIRSQYRLSSELYTDKQDANADFMLNNEFLLALLGVNIDTLGMVRILKV
jgi:hypothetical protein